jgi:hypothetical protein
MLDRPLWRIGVFNGKLRRFFSAKVLVVEPDFIGFGGLYRRSSQPVARIDCCEDSAIACW